MEVVSNIVFVRCIYYLRSKINAILRLDTRTNMWCEIIKIPLIFVEKDPDTILFFYEKIPDTLVFYDSLVKVAIC